MKNSPNKEEHIPALINQLQDNNIQLVLEALEELLKLQVKDFAEINKAIEASGKYIVLGLSQARKDLAKAFTENNSKMVDEFSSLHMKLTHLKEGYADLYGFEGVERDDFLGEFTRKARELSLEETKEILDSIPTVSRIIETGDSETLKNLRIETIDPKTHKLVGVVPQLVKHPIVDEQNTKQIFYNACTKGDLSKVKELVTKKNLLGVRVAGINSKHEEGTTPLMMASANGHKEVVELLLQHGANTDSRAKDGSTALHAASGVGHKHVVELLLKHNANIESCNKNGGTALTVSSEMGHIGIVELLLKHGANIETTFGDGATSLHVASQNGHKDTVDLLLKHHANIESKTVAGVTAIMAASQEGHEDVVEALLKHNANIESKAENGNTALHAASGMGHKRVVELLLMHNANIDSVNNNGNTAQHIAFQCNHRLVGELLLRYKALITNKNRSIEKSVHEVESMIDLRINNATQEIFNWQEVWGDLSKCSIEEMVDKLIEIAKIEGFLNYGGGNRHIFDSHGRNIKARAIGDRLNELGGIELMRKAFDTAEPKLPENTASHLPHCWEFIGDWLP